MRVIAAVLAFLLFSAPAGAVVERPEFAPTLGTAIDTTTVLADETGAAKPLSAWTGGHPALILFGYDDCPNLCGVVQQVTAKALAATGLSPDAYVPLFITLAPEESSADAAGAKARFTDAVGPEAADWHFLSGPDVAALGAEFGIDAIERERIAQFVHPVAVFTVTPDGRISHVLPGLELTPRDLRLALVEASAGTLGTIIDHVMLFCAGYDPTTGRYTPAIMGALRIAGLGVLGLLLAAVLLLEGRRLWTR